METLKDTITNQNRFLVKVGVIIMQVMPLEKSDLTLNSFTQFRNADIDY